ncbi:MBL fold metallo-hydrolase [Pseudomonas aeruginosa]
METLDALTVDGGSWVRRVPLSHTAVLIEHHAATPCSSTLAWGATSTPSSAPTCPGRRRRCSLTRKSSRRATNWTPAGIRVDRILLSHAHWDHASAWSTSPKYRSGAPYEEIAFSRIATPPAAFPPIPPWWRALATLAASIRSRLRAASTKASTCFGDGRRRLLVPLPGHTPGSVRSVSSPSTAGAGCSSAATPVGDSGVGRQGILRRPRPGRSRSRAHPRATGEDPPAAPQRPAPERDSGAPSAEGQAALGHHFPHWLE